MPNLPIDFLDLDQRLSWECSRVRDACEREPEDADQHYLALRALAWRINRCGTTGNTAEVQDSLDVVEVLRPMIVHHARRANPDGVELAGRWFGSWADAVTGVAELLIMAPETLKWKQNGDSGAKSDVLKLPPVGDLLDLWQLLHDGQGAGKSDRRIADEFSRERGAKLLARLKTMRTRQAISDWKQRLQNGNSV